MFVACPQCGFLVAAQSGGTARCPRCGTPIEARQAQPLEQVRPRRRRGKTAAAETQPSTTQVDPDTPDAPFVPAGSVATDTPEPRAPGPAFPDIAPSAESHDAPASTRAGRRAPSFARRHAVTTSHTQRRREWAMAGALALLLALQIVLSQREALAGSAQWRPLIAGLCGVLQCDLPPWRDPSAFAMLHRSVQPRPDRPGVLRVDASFRNDARWAQSWPTILLTLSDMDGRRVGQRAFQPREYLGQDAVGQIAPGQSATLQLDVVEPSQRVVAFTFDFL